MHDRFDHARGWLRKAQSDLATVRLLLEGGGPYDTACFHAQQAAEKGLKAHLALHGQPIPRTHNLEELYLVCAALGPEWPFDDAMLAELTPYAVELRYDVEFWPDCETTQQALELAEKVVTAVIAVIDNEAQPDDQE